MFSCNCVCCFCIPGIPQEDYAPGRGATSDMALGETRGKDPSLPHSLELWLADLKPELD